MWSKIIGHNQQIVQLKKALLGARIPNAYLFSGPHGVGKRLAADTFAGALVCDEAKKNERGPCSVCNPCRKVLGGTHPDVFIVTPESEQKNIETDERGKKAKPSENLKIEQMRVLQAGLQYHPLEAGAKLAIIDEADKMTDASANSLLKILEEPPPATHFILISAKPMTILPTIRSRCMNLSFGPILDGPLAEKISEASGVPQKEAMRIARLSGGSLGLALSIEPEFIGSVLGRFTVLQKKASSADIMETAEGWSHEEPKRARLILDIVASWYRDIVLFYAIGKESALINPEVANLPRDITYERALAKLKFVSKVRGLMDASVNKQLMFEDLLFTLAS